MENKLLLKTYRIGFFKNFFCLWSRPRFQEKNLMEMTHDNLNEAWLQVGKDLRQAYNLVAKEKGFIHEE
jgi:hypothetical protein